MKYVIIDAEAIQKRIKELEKNLIRSILDEFVKTENYRINTARIFRTKQQIEDYIKKLANDEDVKVKFEYVRNTLNIEAKSFRKNIDNFSKRLEFGVKHLGDI